MVEVDDRVKLPWTTESIVSFSHARSTSLENDKEVYVIVTLITNMNYPTEFALLVTVNEDRPVDRRKSQNSGTSSNNLLSRFKAATAKAQRSASALNKFSATYDVMYVIPISRSVDFSVSETTLRLGWSELNSVPKGEIRRELVLFDLSQSFLVSLNVALEISVEKGKHLFVPNGSSTSFSWLWKYGPTIVLPKDLLDRSPNGDNKHLSLTNLLVLSWNVGGLNLIAPPVGDSTPEQVDKLRTEVEYFLRNQLSSNVDLFVLSIQEAAPLTARNVLFSSDKVSDLWLLFFASCMSEEWVKESSVIQVGLALAVFRRRSGALLLETPLLSSYVRTGNFGLTGNKGCVGLSGSISFQEGIKSNTTGTLLSAPQSLSFSVLNLHLTSGDHKAEIRKSELEWAVNYCLFQPGKRESYHPFESDFCLLVGDFNSRVMEGAIEPVDGNKILTEDELIARMRSEGPACPFLEQPVLFPATYKLLPKQQGVLALDPTRRPAWCDRILYRSGTSISDLKFLCTEYSSIRNVDFSDHTPVYAVFSLVIDERV